MATSTGRCGEVSSALRRFEGLERAVRRPGSPGPPGRCWGRAAFPPRRSSRRRRSRAWRRRAAGGSARLRSHDVLRPSAERSMSRIAMSGTRTSSWSRWPSGLTKRLDRDVVGMSCAERMAGRASPSREETGGGEAPRRGVTTVHHGPEVHKDSGIAIRSQGSERVMYTCALHRVAWGEPEAKG